MNAAHTSMDTTITTETTVDGIYANPASYVSCGKCGGDGVYTAKTSGRDYECSACRGSGRNLTRGAKKAIKAIREAKSAAGRAELAPWIKSIRDAAAALPALPDYRDFIGEDGWGDDDAYYSALDALSFEARRAGEQRQMLESIADSADTRGTVTDKQRAAADRIIERLAAPAKPKVAVVTGKIEIVGTVVSTKVVEGAYGLTEKMLVEDDRGFRVWGSVPKKLRLVPCADGESTNTAGERCRYLNKGDRVAFTATVEASRDDECFGFYKRPSKVRFA